MKTKVSTKAQEMRFTLDMVETMLDYFSVYATNEAITLESNEKGVWLKNPNGSRQFLGCADFPAHLMRKLEAVH